MSTPLQHSIDTILAPYRRSGEPGGVAALALHGRVAYRSAFGLANVEHGVANMPATRMPIASISKHITCAAALHLVAQGKLSLDDPVARWLPDLPAAQKRPTLRHLMTHTSGIRCYLDQALFNGYATMPVGMPMAIQQRQVDINFEPGQGSSYCNGGYLLLSLILERASGMAFEDLLQDIFFRPLGMRATSLARRRWPVQPGLATTYLPIDTPAGRGWRHGLALSEERFGDGGIESTADDLLRWAAHLRTSDSPTSLAVLAQPARLANGWKSAYGFGLITERWRGITIVNHAGGLPGANSSFVMLPDEGVDLVLLFNRNAPVREIGLRILDAVLGDRLAPPLPAPAAADHATLMGDYLEPETGLMFGFRDVEGSLGLSLFGGSAFALEGREPRVGELPFGADVGTGEMLFRRPCRAQGDAIEYLDAGSWRRATRIGGTRPDARAMLAGVDGTFHNSQVAASLRLVLQGNEPMLDVRGEYGGATCRAEVVGPDLLRFWPAQFPGGMLARLVRDGVDVVSVVVSTGRTRRTVFEKQELRE